MEGYHADAPRVRNPFVMVAYVPGEDGQWVPGSLPDRCPVSLEKPAIPCRVRVDHRRKRKTGTCSLLVVARCGPHGRAFTLYPCGFGPYARRRIAAVDPDGAQVRTADDEENPLAAWRVTPFEAALDAAQGVPWHRTGRKRMDDTRRWRTQGRWLQLAATLLGLVVMAPERLALAAGLEVPALTLQDAAQAYVGSKGYRGRGEAILSVLRAWPRSVRTAERLLGSGALTGHWGAPMAWDASTRRLRSCAFRPSGVPP